MGGTKAELPDIYELCLTSLSNRVLTRGLSDRPMLSKEWENTSKLLSYDNVDRTAR